MVANYTQKNVSCNLSNEESFISSKEYLLAMLDSPYYFDKIESKMTYKADVFGVNWGKAFKKSIINDYNLQFNEKITIFEDFLFNFDFFTRASKVKCVDTPIYFYRVTRGSLSRTESVDRVLKRMDFINLLSEKEVSEYLKDVLDFCVTCAACMRRALPSATPISPSYASGRSSGPIFPPCRSACAPCSAQRPSMSRRRPRKASALRAAARASPATPCVCWRNAHENASDHRL